MSPAPPNHHPRPLQPGAAAGSTSFPCRLSSRKRPCSSPHAAADALVVEHLPFAARVAANYARRTGHPKEDLEQLAAIGLIKASRRYDSQRVNRSCSNFIAYARPYVNGEITHYLRDKGFLISVPGRWRELHARGQKLLRQGVTPAQVPQQLGLTPERWAEIAAACSVRVVAMAISDDEALRG
jgi:DNA-directed RNA polymerase specialized sigma subunit